MASGVPVGKAFVDILPDMNTTAFAAAGKRGGTTASRGFGGTFVAGIKSVTKLAVVGLAGVGVAAAGAFVGLAKIGGNFDKAYDTIRTGTGATGKALEGLKGTFKNVFSSVPTDMGTASTAVADLNTALGLTGKPLKDLSVQMINLSRITDTDVSKNIKATTRVFGDWDIATKDQAETLDKLFRASQATGSGVDELSKRVVQFGAPMRQMGFSFDESIALLGKFEKEGVNTELVMGSMRQALGKMAREGEPAAKTFRRVSKEIKTAGSTSEANSKAMELFGARAGPDMAAAIREGRFEIDDLVGTIKNGGDTINGVADETDSWKEKLQVLGNKVVTALEPLAAKVFDGLGKAVEAATPHIEAFSQWLAVNLPKAAEAVSQAFTWVRENVIPPLVAAFQTAVTWFRDNWPQIKEILIGVWEAYKEYFTSVVIPLVEGVITAFKSIVEWFKENWPQIRQTISELVTWLQDEAWPIIQEVATIIRTEWEKLVAWVQEYWPKIKETIDSTIQAVKVIIEATIKVITYIWDKWGEELMAIAKAVFEAIRKRIESAIQVIRGILQTITSLIRGDWSGAWDGIKDILFGTWETIKTIPDAAMKVLKEVLSGALDAVVDLWAGAWDGIASTADEIWDDITSGVSDFVDDVVDFVMGIPGDLVSLGADLYSAARDGFGQFVIGVGHALYDVWDTITSPFRSAINTVIGWWNGIEFTIPTIEIPRVEVFGRGFGGNSVGGQTFQVPQIPTLHSGGIVPGTGDVPAILEGGEGVFTREQMAAIGAGAIANSREVVVGILKVEGGSDEVARLLQKWIRTEHGGNVQVALGQ